MRLFYNDCNLNGTSKKLDEIEAFFDVLKLIDNMSVNQMRALLDQTKLSNIPPNNSEPNNDGRSADIDSVLQQIGVNSLNYENITVEQIQQLEATNAFTKTLSIQLANAIGISKKSYKSRREVFEDIYRMVNNRDTLNATKNVLTNDTDNK